MQARRRAALLMFFPAAVAYAVLKTQT